MASELEPAPLSERSWANPLRRRAMLARANLSQSWRLVANRRRDLRFRILPTDALQLVNAAAIILSLLAIINVVLDPLLVAWQERLAEAVVQLFRYITRFGKSDWILVSTSLFLIAMLLLDAATLRPRLRVKRTLRSLAAFYVFASVAIAGIIANVSKYVIGRARPEYFPETGSVSFDFWSGDASWASFPSGHATTAMALGVSLALLFPQLRWVFLCIAFWIAASRLFILVHYPSDMFAGCLLGGCTAWLFARAFAQRRLIFRFDDDGRLMRRNGASGRLL